MYNNTDGGQMLIHSELSTHLWSDETKTILLLCVLSGEHPVNYGRWSETMMVWWNFDYPKFYPGNPKSRKLGSEKSRVYYMYSICIKLSIKFTRKFMYLLLLEVRVREVEFNEAMFPHVQQTSHGQVTIRAGDIIFYQPFDWYVLTGNILPPLYHLKLIL